MAVCFWYEESSVCDRPTAKTAFTRQERFSPLVVLGGELAVPWTRNPLSGAEFPFEGSADGARTELLHRSDTSQQTDVNPVRSGRKQR